MPEWRPRMRAYTRPPLGCAIQAAVDSCHVFASQFEIKDRSVLTNPLRSDRLRDDHEPVLQAPPNHDLRGRTGVLRGKLRDDRMFQPAPARERAVGLELDSVFLAKRKQVLLEEERMELDLVDGWRRRRSGQELLQVSDRVIAHADRTGEALVVQLQEGFPRIMAKAGDGPMNQVQVDVIEPEVVSALLERLEGRFVAVVTVP